MVFSLELDSKIIADVMKNSKECKNSKEEFARLIDNRDKQVYYLLTEYQLKLLLKFVPHADTVVGKVEQ